MVIRLSPTVAARLPARPRRRNASAHAVDANRERQQVPERDERSQDQAAGEGGVGAAVEVAGDEEDDRGDRRGEAHRARDRERIGDTEEDGLLAPLPDDAMK